MKKRKIIEIGDWTVVTIENRCVTILQVLLADRHVVVLNVDDIMQIAKEIEALTED